MDSGDIDKLAFALLTSIKWAIDGGKIEKLPKVHEELTTALDLVFNKTGSNPIINPITFKERKTAVILAALQKKWWKN